MPPPVPSAFLWATGQDTSRHGAAHPGDWLERPHSSGAVALTAAQRSSDRSSGGNAGSMSGEHEQCSTTVLQVLLPQDAREHSTHASHSSAAPREGALSGHGQLRDAGAAPPKAQHSEGGGRAPRLASRPDDSCCGKPEPARRARASKAGSGDAGAFRWTQLWPVRLCADCARRGHLSRRPASQGCGVVMSSFQDGWCMADAPCVAGDAAPFGSEALIRTAMESVCHPGQPARSHSGCGACLRTTRSATAQPWTGGASRAFDMLQGLVGAGRADHGGVHAHQHHLGAVRQAHRGPGAAI